jgi:hypothetical protein
MMSSQKKPASAKKPKLDTFWVGKYNCVVKAENSADALKKAIKLNLT